MQTSNTYETNDTTILVVDDEADIREPLCEHLNINGFHAIGVANATQAYELLDSEPVDLVVLDVIANSLRNVAARISTRKNHCDHR